MNCAICVRGMLNRNLSDRRRFNPKDDRGHVVPYPHSSLWTGSQAHGELPACAAWSSGSKAAPCAIE